ncbi:DHBP synthase RibB-like alpha/beta domain-containing protein [Phlyctochytrium arcticum]|nr:DHBP synthase RibB-like alpha/beta domain-containing protein [Phlyctochytrium arcticum]
MEEQAVSSGGDQGRPAIQVFETELKVINPALLSFPPSDQITSLSESTHLAPVLADSKQTAFSSSSAEDVSAIYHAADLLRDNNVVAFPTETVYGLAANALNPTAVKKIFQAKGRPSDNPLIVHISSLSMLKLLMPEHASIPDAYVDAIKHHWPGPLTILVPRGPNVPLEVTGGHQTVAVRFPSHPIARALISACGFPLAAPSANLSGRPSPTLAHHVFNDLKGRIPLILDGGACGFGVESTVLDGLSSPPAILRPGGVTFESLQTLPQLTSLRVYRKDFVDKNMEDAPTTPGMKYRHYTPNAEVVLFERASGTDGSGLRHKVDQHTAELLREGQKSHLQGVGIMRTTQVPEQAPSLPNHLDFSHQAQKSPRIYDLHLGSDLATVAHCLFNGLRMLDTYGTQIILVEGVEEAGEGLAIMNRLRKAASKIIRA